MYYNIIDCICCAEHYILITHLFYNWRSVPLNPLHLFYLTPAYFPSGVLQFVFCIYDSVSVLFCSFGLFLASIYKWNHVVFVFLWLISLSIIHSRSIHVMGACLPSSGPPGWGAWHGAQTPYSSGRMSADVISLLVVGHCTGVWVLCLCYPSWCGLFFISLAVENLFC